MQNEIIMYLLTIIQVVLIAFLSWLGVTVVALTKSVEGLTTVIRDSLSRRMNACESRLKEGDEAFETIRSRLDRMETRCSERRQACEC